MSPRSRTTVTALAVAAALGISSAQAQTSLEQEEDETRTPSEVTEERAATSSDESDPDLAARRTELIRVADEALRQLRLEDSEAAQLMEQAYGHAVFATTKGGLFLTGAGGTGVARPHDSDEVTFMRLGSAGIGLGGGFESYRLILLFRDEDVFSEFITGEWDGALAAQAAAGSQGVSAEEQFIAGIRAFRVSGGGLMAQADITGVRFWPARNLNRAAEVEARVAIAAERGEPVGPEAVRDTQVAASDTVDTAETADRAPDDREPATFDTTDEELAAAAETTEIAHPERLTEIAAEREDLDTIVEALQAVGLDETLTGATAYTVFAPTDEAFETMAGMSPEELLAPENRDALIRLLRAHIVADDLDREMAGNIPEALTVDGDTVSIDIEGNRFMVGNASVVAPDLTRGNLRVHVIDQVLEAPTQVAVAEGVETEPGGAAAPTQASDDIEGSAEPPIDAREQEQPPIENRSARPAAEDRPAPPVTEGQRSGPVTEEAPGVEDEGGRADPVESPENVVP